ncbi:hypothetical protein K2173_027546 [Erythroxylum novogranatense]|uniref:Uncharacterized protein n=1 Tax=Erythroxylum novogranatense TaxID=1862640 RepID=A0AAV8U268_9ROSI|nr:hypothetical protein K2173_027546 [Erythroxylum novogranatense]
MLIVCVCMVGRYTCRRILIAKHVKLQCIIGCSCYLIGLCLPVGKDRTLRLVGAQNDLLFVCTISSRQGPMI